MLSTYTIEVTSITIDWYFDEFSHSIIKSEVHGSFGATSICPFSVGCELLEGFDPGVDRFDHSVIELGESICNISQRVYILFISVIDIFEHQISRWSSFSVLGESIEEIICVRVRDQGDVLVQP